jgi:hypothetical protein
MNQDKEDIKIIAALAFWLGCVPVAVFVLLAFLFT